MNKAIICIGSNEDKEKNIALCGKLLSQSFDNIIFSKTVISTAYGEIYRSDFMNQLAYIVTDEDIDKVSLSLKIIEEKMGRNPEDKLTGRVIIDIDLLTWNEEILRPEDMQREYVMLMHEQLSEDIKQNRLAQWVQVSSK